MTEVEIDNVKISRINTVFLGSKLVVEEMYRDVSE